MPMEVAVSARGETRERREENRVSAGTGRASGRAEAPIHKTHLIHLQQSPLSHLLQRDDPARLLMPREVHLAVSALPNLGDNVELVQLEFGAALAKEDPLATAVRGP